METFDYSQAQSLMEEPAWIKAKLPIAYVAEAAGMQLVSSDGRVHALCPFHQDRNPSFDIYPWGAGERFGCFACGAGGDVLDFIQRMWQLGFREACEMAKRGIVKMEAEGWKAPRLGAVFEWDEAAAREMLNRAEWSDGALEHLINSKGWIFPASHLAAGWGVRHMGGQILVPIWDEDQHLVGVKHRPVSGARPLVSLPGSKLRSTLYGAHQGLYVGGYDMRPTGADVILCEGESDVWTASWLLKNRRPVYVLGIPAGAGAAPVRLDLLHGRRVWIALDGDVAGRMSALRWQEALPGSVILDLPDGEDITSITAKDPHWLIDRLT